MSIFQITPILSTLLSGKTADILYQVNEGISIIAYCMLTEAAIKKNPKMLLETYSIYIGLLAIINAYTIYNESNYTKYFLSGENVSYPIILSFSVFICMLNYYKKGKITLFSYAIIAFVSSAYFYVWSATAVVVSAFFLVVMIFYKLLFRQKLFNYFTLLTAITIVFILLVVFTQVDFLKTIIVNILKKDLSLTGRISIWEISKDFISRKPFIGYGNGDIDTFIRLANINHTHNIVLEILYKSGLLGLIAYIVMLIITGLNLSKNKTFFSSIISLGIFIYLLNSMMDYYNSVYIPFGLFVVGYNISYLNKSLDRQSVTTKIHSNEV
jgi:O-antigen ligase